MVWMPDTDETRMNLLMGWILNLNEKSEEIDGYIYAGDQLREDTRRRLTVLRGSYTRPAI
jgi:hypothetical protein